MSEDTQKNRKERQGEVVSNKADKTIVVLGERIIQHPLLKKYIRQHKKFYAHDAENTCNVGDTVRITECRPMSKSKRWRLVEVLARAK